MSLGFPPRSETNLDVQAREIARGLKVHMGFVALISCAVTAPVFALYAKAVLFPRKRVNNQRTELQHKSF